MKDQVACDRDSGYGRVQQHPTLFELNTNKDKQAQLMALIQWIRTFFSASINHMIRQDYVFQKRKQTHLRTTHYYFV